MAAIDYVAVVQQLYVSYFGRPADYYGLKSFTQQLDDLKAPTDFEALNTLVQSDKAGTTALSKLVNSFNASAESAALYGTDNSTIGLSKFVAAIYTNVLGREADVDGLTFWVTEIAAGRLTRANAAMAITDGALNNTSAQGLLDAKTVENKLAVATNFTDALDTTSEINGFSGDKAAASARDLLASVTNTTDPVAFQPTVDAAIAAIVTGSQPSQTFTLTAGVDTFPGASGNDIFNALPTTTGGATLTSLDSIDGGAGNDTLNVVDTAAAATPYVLPTVTVKNVENVNVTSANNTVEADVSGWTGVTKLTTQSIGGATITAGASTNVISTDSKLGVGTASITGGNDVTVTAQKVGLAGAVTVAGAAGNVVVNTTTTAVAVGDITVTGGKTVTVNQTAGNAVNTTTTLGKVTVNGAAATTAVTVTGSKAATAAADTVGVTNNAIIVNDVNKGSATKAGTITTVSASGYTTLNINDNALTDLTVANGSGNITIDNSGLTTATNKTLNLSVNGLTGGTLDDADIYTKLNVTTTGANSTLANITDTALTDLTVAGEKVLTLTSTAGLTVLKNVTVSGSAGLKADLSAASVATVDASATSGAVTVTIDATKVAYKGGSGADVVTLTAAAPTKAATLGAGNDTIILQTLATTVGVTIDGGADTNTVQTTFALASSGADAHTELVNFSKLAISDLADASGAAKTIDLVNFGTKSYIDLVAGAKTAAAGKDLTIGSLDSNGTVEFNAANTGAGKVIVAVSNALAGTAEVLNLKLNATAGGAATAFATVDASNVETVIVNSTTGDTDAAKIAADSNTLTLSAASATTVNVTGNVLANLTGSTLTAVTKVDASAATGGATVNVNGASAAVTYLGGSGVDTVVLNGKANAVTLGGGKDIVTFTGVSSTATVFSTITDIAAGDTINLSAVVDNTTGKIGAAITSPFGSDIFSLLNAASAFGGAGHASWFVFNNDTYVVQDNSAAGTFTAGSDLIIKLAGVHDLSNSTLTNAAAGFVIV